jgi:predicted ATP-grasp superfamily ATP-dependent carboligase
VYYRAEIDLGGEKTFSATVNRFESDANTETDAYVKEQYSSIKDAWSNFGYNTMLEKFNSEVCNVICPAIDISGLSTDEARAVFNNGGNIITKILGRQTPLHIRGNVYDNT